VISQTALVGGGRVYVVQEGDTLSSIAHYELGKISRWAEIYELNREAIGKEYNYLTPGMQLVMPSKEKPSSDRMTRQPEDSGPYRR
jgi:nucleoid-associated protein YgaU